MLGDFYGRLMFKGRGTCKILFSVIPLGPKFISKKVNLFSKMVHNFFKLLRFRITLYITLKHIKQEI